MDEFSASVLKAGISDLNLIPAVNGDQELGSFWLTEDVLLHPGSFAGPWSHKVEIQ